MGQVNSFPSSFAMALLSTLLIRPLVETIVPDFKKTSGNFNGLGKQPPGIVPHIENQSLQGQR